MKGYLGRNIVRTHSSCLHVAYRRTSSTLRCAPIPRPTDRRSDQAYCYELRSRSTQQLQEQADHFLALIETEKRGIDTVAEQTGMMKHKILHQRKMMGGVNAAKENEYMVQKQVQKCHHPTIFKIQTAELHTDAVVRYPSNVNAGIRTTCFC